MKVDSQGYPLGGSRRERGLGLPSPLLQPPETGPLGLSLPLGSEGPQGPLQQQPLARAVMLPGTLQLGTKETVVSTILLSHLPKPGGVVSFHQQPYYL